MSDYFKTLHRIQLPGLCWCNANSFIDEARIQKTGVGEMVLNDVRVQRRIPSRQVLIVQFEGNHDSQRIVELASQRKYFPLFIEDILPLFSITHLRLGKILALGSARKTEKRNGKWLITVPYIVMLKEREKVIEDESRLNPEDRNYYQQLESSRSGRYVASTFVNSVSSNGLVFAVECR